MCPAYKAHNLLRTSQPPNDSMLVTSLAWPDLIPHRGKGSGIWPRVEKLKARASSKLARYESRLILDSFPGR